MRCVIDEIHAALAEKLGDIRAAELLANWQLRPPAEAEAPAPKKFKFISIKEITAPILDFEYVEPELDLPRANIIEDLDEPMHFLNRQWAVTKYGLECITPSRYEIEAWRLKALRMGQDGIPDWPLHMAEKEWVSIPLFLEAFKVALKVHRVKHGFVENWEDEVLRKIGVRQRYYQRQKRMEAHA